MRSVLLISPSTQPGRHMDVYGRFIQTNDMFSLGAGWGGCLIHAPGPPAAPLPLPSGRWREDPRGVPAVVPDGSGRRGAPVLCPRPACAGARALPPSAGRRAPGQYPKGGCTRRRGPGTHARTHGRKRSLSQRGHTWVPTAWAAVPGARGVRRTAHRPGRPTPRPRPRPPGRSSFGRRRLRLTPNPPPQYVPAVQAYRSRGVPPSSHSPRGPRSRAVPRCHHHSTARLWARGLTRPPKSWGIGARGRGAHEGPLFTQVRPQVLQFSVSPSPR